MRPDRGGLGSDRQPWLSSTGVASLLRHETKDIANRRANAHLTMDKTSVASSEFLPMQGENLAHIPPNPISSWTRSAHLERLRDQAR
jgi:hypothetical protein